MVLLRFAVGKLCYDVRGGNRKIKNPAVFKPQDFSVSINLSARWQASKKEGKFAEHGFVGVCDTVESMFGESKQKALKSSGFQGFFNTILLF